MVGTVLGKISNTLRERIPASPAPNLERIVPIVYVEAQQGHLPRFKLEMFDESLAKRDGLTLAFLALAFIVNGLDGAGKPLIPFKL